MAKTNGTEATIDTPSRQRLPGDASMFTFDPGGGVGGTYESGDFSLTSTAAAWFMRAQLTAWQDYTRGPRAMHNFTADALGFELSSMDLNILDLAALRNLLTTAIEVLDHVYYEAQIGHDTAVEIHKHSISVIPEVQR